MVKTYFKISLFLTLVTLTSCSWLNDSNDEPSTQLKELEGFAIIPAKGKSVTLGKAESTMPELTPAVQVNFEYDFYLAKTEFTVGEYNKLMNKNLSGDSLNPLNNVNWFEAILIANAKSKSENLDTVYTYQEVTTAIEGHIINISNLKTNYEIDGYRLPTEAEWSLAASWGHSGDYPFEDNLELALNHGWFNENSENAVHHVGLKTPNALDIFDMAGNLMEFTADWKGQLPEAGTKNYIGQLNANPLNEKVLKGGYYAAPPTPWYSRSDTYTFSVNSTSPYLGFRLARGKILNAISSYQGLATDVNIGKFASNYSKMNVFLGNRKAKLVYVDHLSNSLIYAKIEGVNSTIQPIYTWGIPVYHPVISPDGNWVAFSTKPEGVAGSSSVFLKYLANPFKEPIEISDKGSIPRWHVDSTGTTSLIYTSDSETNQEYSLWLKKNMFKQKIIFNLDKVTLFKPERLKVPGTYNGGFSQDLNFWSAGYTKLYKYETSKSTPELLFTSPQNGKSADGSSQVCNVSVSPDNNKDLLFIDFGYSEKSTITGDSYKIHEYLFTANSSGEIQNWYKTPKGYSNWNFPEWSNHSNYAVSSVVDKQENPSSLWAVNLKDSSYLPLIEGANLWMPYLWLGDTLNTPIDEEILLEAISKGVGQYRFPLSSSHLPEIAIKMNIFWNNYQSADYAVLGSSHAKVIYPALYADQFRGLNLAAAGNNFSEQKTIALDYLSRSKKLKIIFLSGDFTWWRTDKERFAESLEKSHGYIQDQKNDFWPDSEELIKQSSDYEVAQLPNAALYDIYGGINHFVTADWKEPIIGDTDPWTWDDDTSQLMWKNFIDLVNTITKQGIHVALVEYPQNPQYKDTDYHGYYGPLKTTWDEIEKSIENFKSENPLFHYIDLNKEGNHDFTERYARDQDHLNFEGGKVATKIFMDSMNVWLP